jgi:hypothetical protein
MYAYSGDLTEKQILEYTSNWQATDPITKDELISSLKVENKWGDIDDVLNSVKEITRILPTLGDDTYWYVKTITITTFKTLTRILHKAKSCGGKKVRIHFA